jgi:hypothetical protein
VCIPDDMPLRKEANLISEIDKIVASHSSLAAVLPILLHLGANNFKMNQREKE